MCAATVTICMINQKGGCGKSSSCFHLSGHFARCGLSVLLVDADPQGSLSQGFFGSSLVENLQLRETVAALFDDSTFVSSPQSLAAPTGLERIWLVRANHTLAPHNGPKPEESGLRQFAIRVFLELPAFWS